MSDIEKAARDAVEAADNTDLTRQIVAILAAQQLLNSQQAPQPPAQRQEFDATKWLVIGGVVVSVGLVASLFAVAIAIGAVCATTCLLILRSVWRDIQKGR
ncbi:hypothetical protein ACFVZL_19855 [Streptomyces sp. NPDC058320]|uniref:hypothetical protein n=1 Tax=unclassified Streptomyces TaxID=2593676 RepID=UPI003637AC77